MKVMICQTDPKLLDIQANLEKTIEQIHSAKEQQVDLVVFPELALTGYFVQDKYHTVALTMAGPEIKRLAKATKGTAAVVGFVEESRSMNFYNSALIAVDGEVLFAYRKLNLPNYGIFEERKIFRSGKRVQVFRYKNLVLAPFICNDLWHPSLPYLGITQKADIFISLYNSSQGSMGNEFSNIESWSIINRFYSRIFGVYNLCANRVGKEMFDFFRSPDIKIDTDDLESSPFDDDPLRFWGGSEIINPFGLAICKAEMYKPDVIVAELSRDLIRKKRIMLPYLHNDDPYFTHRELSRILFEKANF